MCVTPSRERRITSKPGPKKPGLLRHLPRCSEFNGRGGSSSVVERIRSFRIPLVAVLLVIFGAGASYDSVPGLPPPPAPYPALRPIVGGLTRPEIHRPPLANQLFDDRPGFVEVMARFPDCIPLVPQLRKPA